MSQSLGRKTCFILKPGTKKAEFLIQKEKKSGIKIDLIFEKFLVFKSDFHFLSLK